MSETNKYYCVESYPNSLTKGQIYGRTDKGEMVYDDSISGMSYASYELFKKEHPSIAACLVPLVQRPAKVGEWVYPLSNCEFKRYIQGELLRVTDDCMGDNSTWQGRGVVYYHKNCDKYVIPNSQYLVLDSYQPNQPKGEQTMTLQQQLEAAKAERDAKDKLIAEIEKQIEEAGKPWRPKYRQVCYMANPLSENFCDSIIWENSSTGNRLYAAGLITRTTPEAAEIGKRMYYRAWAESLSDVTEEMWKDQAKLKYIRKWSYRSNKLTTCTYNELRDNGAYFASEAALHAAIATIGEDNWIKYVLGVQR